MTRDWVLVEWAALANRGQLGDVQMTFQSGGLVLCGTLIGGREYFEGVGRLATEGMHEADRARDVTDAFASLYAAHASNYTLAESHPTAEIEGPQFLHFKDVQVLLANMPYARPCPLEVPFWRTKIEAVDGFLLGGSIQHLPVSTAPATGDEAPTADRDD